MTSKVVILGSSNAVSTPYAENTHFAVIGDERMVLVDSVSNPIVRMEQAGLDLQKLTDIIVTHFHPDHASGIPLLLMDMWLLGRREALNLYGLYDTLDRIEKLMELYSWKEWPNFFPINFHRLPSDELTPVLDCPDFTIKSSLVHHMVPTIGLRLEFNKSGKSLAYSCDTEPCEEVVRLADGVDVLIHEATGESFGHSSARQAGEIAAKAEARKLYMIHYPTGRFAKGDLIAEAGETFNGEIDLAKDFMVLDFSKRIPLSHFARGVSGKVRETPEKPPEP